MVWMVWKIFGRVFLIRGELTVEGDTVMTGGLGECGGFWMCLYLISV